MKPLFTIHAGEYVVARHLESEYPKLRIWVPTRDTGIDLLVTNRSNNKCVSLQVKYSCDFLDRMMQAQIQRGLKACGWWSIKRKKIEESEADYWVFALIGFASKSTDFVVLKPADLLRRLKKIYGTRDLYQVYFWITKDSKVWETRSLQTAEKIKIAESKFSDQKLDFSQYLDCWDMLDALQ